MKPLTNIVCIFLIMLGLVSVVMAVLGLSLTPLVLGGVLLGLGVLILNVQYLHHTMRELAGSIRYSAYVKDPSVKDASVKDQG
jgi:hypothetical protein